MIGFNSLLHQLKDYFMVYRIRVIFEGKIKLSGYCTYGLT
jgi:hypothetical protein